MGVGDFVYNGVATAGGTSAGGGIDLQIGGNTTGTTALVSSGTLTLAGGTNITLSQNGNGITINGPAFVTNSFWRPSPQAPNVTVQMGQSSLFIYPIQQQGYATATMCNIPISMSVSSSSNSSHAGSVSISVGFYTRSGSTLSSVSSGSAQYVWTNTSNNSMTSLTGGRWLSVPINMNMTPGDYYFAVWSATSSANANWFTMSNVIYTALALSGPFLAATNDTLPIMEGYGNLQTAAFPASIPFSAMSVTNVRDYILQGAFFANHS